MSPLSPNSQRSSLRVSEHPWRFLSPLRSCPTPSNAAESPFSLRHVWVAISAFPSPSDPATKASNSLHREVSSQPPPPPVLLASSWLFLYFVAIKKAQEKKKEERILNYCYLLFSFFFLGDQTENSTNPNSRVCGLFKGNYFVLLIFKEV